MDDDKTAKAIKGLTAAVWALAFVLLVGTVAPFLWSYLSQAPQALPPQIGSSDVATPPRPSGFKDEYEGFHEWPIEQKIANASAILLTENAVTDGKVVGTVKEVLMHEPGTELYYKVGDQYQEQVARPDTSYGDGEIVFFIGSPAQMRFSTTYRNGRCSGLGDMPIDQLRQLISRRGRS